MMGHRGKLKSGDEWDGLTRARHWHIWRAGDRKAIKRGYNRRQRRIIKAELARC